jgi:hypothetical protein
MQATSEDVTSQILHHHKKIRFSEAPFLGVERRPALGRHTRSYVSRELFAGRGEGALGRGEWIGRTLEGHGIMACRRRSKRLRAGEKFGSHSACRRNH